MLNGTSHGNFPHPNGHLPLARCILYMIIWQSHLFRHGTQDYCHTLFHNGGMTSRALSEQGNSLQAALEDTALLRAAALLTGLIFLLLSLFMSLFTPSP